MNTQLLRLFAFTERSYLGFDPIRTATPDIVVSSPHGPVAPNVNDWREGDVLLCHPRNLGALGAVNLRFQEVWRDDTANARWTHVAVVGANSIIWEAMPNSDVRALTVREFLRDKSKVRRLRLKVAPEGGIPITGALMRLLGGRYRLDIEMMKEFSWSPRESFQYTGIPLEFDIENFICSTFVTKVLIIAARRHPLPEVQVQFPIDFARSDNFKIQTIGWYRVVT